MARKPKRSHRAYKEWVPSVRKLEQSFIIITHAWENMKVIKTWRDPTQPNPFPLGELWGKGSMYPHLIYDL